MNIIEIIDPFFACMGNLIPRCWSWINAKWDGLTPPQLSLFIVMLLTSYFGKAIKDWIQSGYIKLGPNALEFGSNQQSSNLPQQQFNQLTKDHSQTDNYYQYETIKETEQRLKKWKKDFLKQDLAYYYFLFRCEHVYSRIHGTQIQLLEDLQHYGPYHQKKIDNHFKNAASSFPEYNKHGWSPYKYVSFLKKNYLISKKRENKPLWKTSYEITLYGQDFLQWLRNEKIDKNKPW